MENRIVICCARILGSKGTIGVAYWDGHTRRMTTNVVVYDGP